jgi:hypothetical protein
MDEGNRNTEKSKCVHKTVYEWNKMTKRVKMSSAYVQKVRQEVRTYQYPTRALSAASPPLCLANRRPAVHVPATGHCGRLGSYHTRD